jgi:hypothetical protein
MMSGTACVEERANIVIISIKSEVAIELAVIRVARVALCAAPYLPGGLHIASKGNEPIGERQRGKDPFFGTGLGK